MYTYCSQFRDVGRVKETKIFGTAVSKKTLVNNQIDAQSFFVYDYYNSVHVSNTHVLIIRRIKNINTTPGLCHSENVVLIQLILLMMST